MNGHQWKKKRFLSTDNGVEYHIIMLTEYKLGVVSIWQVVGEEDKKKKDNKRFTL